MARFLATEKDDERAAMLAAIHGRLGEEIEPEDALPERVRVMTMHGAKGLAATIVFIPGLEEEMLPGERRARFPGQVLEAARMLYVSITRAKLACVVSYADARFINGQTARHSPSRFTTALGKAFSARTGGVPGRGSTARGRGGQPVAGLLRSHSSIGGRPSRRVLRRQLSDWRLRRAGSGQRALTLPRRRRRQAHRRPHVRERRWQRSAVVAPGSASL